MLVQALRFLQKSCKEVELEVGGMVLGKNWVLSFHVQPLGQ